MAIVIRQSIVMVSATADNLMMRSVVSIPSSTERDLRICRESLWSTLYSYPLIVCSAHHHQCGGACHLGNAQLLSAWYMRVHCSSSMVATSYPLPV